jgi:hypothetical protein
MNKGLHHLSSYLPPYPPYLSYVTRVSEKDRASKAFHTDF